MYEFMIKRKQNITSTTLTSTIRTSINGTIRAHITSTILKFSFCFQRMNDGRK